MHVMPVVLERQGWHNWRCIIYTVMCRPHVHSRVLSLQEKDVEQHVCPGLPLVPHHQAGCALALGGGLHVCVSDSTTAIGISMPCLVLMPRWVHCSVAEVMLW